MRPSHPPHMSKPELTRRRPSTQVNNCSVSAPCLFEMATLTFMHPTLISHSSFVSRHRLTAASRHPYPVTTARLPLTPLSGKSSPLRMPSSRSRPKPLPRRIASVAAAIGAAFIPFLPHRVNSAHLHLTVPQTTQPTHSSRIPPLSSSPHIRLTSRSQYNSPTLATALPTALSPKFSPLRVVLPQSTDPLIHKALKYALLLGIASFLVTATTIAVFWVIQDSLVYKPTKVWRGSPRASGMPYYDDVNYCTIDGVEISGWFIKQPPKTYKNARTLVYFHGTDKNASFRLKKVIGFYEHCQCNILLLSYRGYGLSTGKPNERGVRIDAESAYRYLKMRGDVNVEPGGNLWVYGESLGGAVAIHFSNVYQHCINALILENTFTSLLDMIKLEFPILGVFRYLSRNRWQSKKRIGDLHIPLLFLSGLRDSYIPPAMMKQMHVLATSSPLKEFVEFERGTHNRTWTMDGFYESVARFMDRVDRFKRAGAPFESAGVSVSSGRDDTGRYATAA